MGKAQRDKGKRGERELAKRLREYGYDTRRGQQFCGLEGDADVIGIPGLHIECKRVNGAAAVTGWLEQSARDAKADEVPVVMHRRDNEAWKVTLSLEHFMQLWSEATK